jgi:hypothetical protein
MSPERVTERRAAPRIVAHSASAVATAWTSRLEKQSCTAPVEQSASDWRSYVSEYARVGNRTHTPSREREFKCLASISKLLTYKVFWRRRVKVCKKVCKFNGFFGSSSAGGAAHLNRLRKVTKTVTLGE